MTFLKSSLKHVAFSALSIVGGVALGATLVGAATTISTSITTAGGYTQSGTSANTFTGATTLSAAGTALDVTNNATIGGTLGVTGVTTATGGVKVGSSGTTMTQIVSGVCNTDNVNITASSTGMVSCSGATGVASGDRVFVTATSSIPNNFVIQAASSTAATVIQVDILNIPTTTADSGPDDTGVQSLYFWAVR